MIIELNITQPIAGSNLKWEDGPVEIFLNMEN